jgi:hypothetical protein
MRRQRIDFYSLVLCLAVLTINLSLSSSTENYLIPQAIAQKDNFGNSTGEASSATQFNQSAIESVFTSLTSPKTSAHNSSKLNEGTATVASPPNPTNSVESAIGTFLNPKVLLSSAIDQIRNSTASSVRSNDSNRNGTIVVGDYDTVLLSRQIIPPKDFMPLFDAPLYNVMEGHVSAKLPCNANSTSPLKIFIAKIRVGQTLELKPVQLQLVSDLSKPGYTCVYHERLPFTTSGASNGAKGNNTNMAISGATDNLIITDIGLLNPTDYQVILPDASSIAIGFDELMPSVHRHPFSR